MGESEPLCLFTLKDFISQAVGQKNFNPLNFGCLNGNFNKGIWFEREIFYLLVCLFGVL